MDEEDSHVTYLAYSPKLSLIMNVLSDGSTQSCTSYTSKPHVLCICFECVVRATRTLTFDWRNQRLPILAHM